MFSGAVPRPARLRPAWGEDIMTDKKPGAIINVRVGMYEDSSGFLYRGWIHDHVCAVPGCGLLLDCHQGAWNKSDQKDRRWACEVYGPDPLCTVHEGSVPCGYCGEYGHDADHCPEAVSTESDCAWSKADHDEHEADVAYAEERDSR